MIDDRLAARHIHYYLNCSVGQEEERKRKEKEERIAREEEFLRSSLRGSRKLQALESSPRHPAAAAAGVVNIAYTTMEDEEDEDDDDDVNGQVSYALTNGMHKVVGKLDDFFH